MTKSHNRLKLSIFLLIPGLLFFWQIYISPFSNNVLGLETFVRRINENINHMILSLKNIANNFSLLTSKDISVNQDSLLIIILIFNVSFLFALAVIYTYINVVDRLYQKCGKVLNLFASKYVLQLISISFLILSYIGFIDFYKHQGKKIIRW